MKSQDENEKPKKCNNCGNEEFAEDIDGLYTCLKCGSEF
jgi:ribosomal protein L37AE/L43A